MRYIDKVDLKGKEMSVAAFNADPFAVEGDAVAQMADAVEAASDIVELSPEDADFVNWSQRLDFVEKLPGRIFIGIGDGGAEAFAFVLSEDNPYFD